MNPISEQERKWKKEACELWIHDNNLGLGDFNSGYLAACKKRQEEIELLRQELKRERECVDFYAEGEKHLNGIDYKFIYGVDKADFEYLDRTLEGWGSPWKAGKLARQTIAKRRVEL
jgi:hypothetical protein